MTFDQIQSKLDVLKANFEQLERVYEVLTQHRSDLPQLLHQLLTALGDERSES